MPDPSQPPPNDESVRSRWRWLHWPVLIAAVLGLQAWVVKPVQVPSGSMRDTIECHDRLLVDRITPRFRGYERGQIVVFRPPYEPSGTPVDPEAAMRDVKDGIDDRSDLLHPWRATYIKRLIGKPGDEVEVVDGGAVVNGKRLNEPYAVTGSSAKSLNWGPATVPEDAYFVLGDNRGHSADSRYMGFVPQQNMVGVARVRYWPLGRAGGISAHDHEPGKDLPVRDIAGC
jgi:signal peptidase I